MTEQTNELVERTQNEARTTIEKLQAQLSQAKKQAEQDRLDKEKALEKAKANSLSHYIVNALRNRKSTFDAPSDANTSVDEQSKTDQKEDENK